VTLKQPEESLFAAFVADVGTGDPESIRSALDRYLRRFAMKNGVPLSVAREALAREAARRLAGAKGRPT